MPTGPLPMTDEAILNGIEVLINELRARSYPSRERSIVITKLQEAKLWLLEAERVDKAAERR